MTRAMRWERHKGTHRSLPCCWVWSCAELIHSGGRPPALRTAAANRQTNTHSVLLIFSHCVSLHLVTVFSHPACTKLPVSSQSNQVMSVRNSNLRGVIPGPVEVPQAQARRPPHTDPHTFAAVGSAGWDPTAWPVRNGNDVSADVQKKEKV